MNALWQYAAGMLSDAFQERVKPLAEALDRNPSGASLESGRRMATARAAAIGAQLAVLLSQWDQSSSGADGTATFESAKTLLSDLCDVAAPNMGRAAAAIWARLREWLLGPNRPE